MCFYFIIIFFLERKINVWEESLPPLMITLVFGVGLYWKIPICGLQENEKLLSLTNLWFLCTTLGFARWKSLIHSVSLPPTPELILNSHASPHTRYRTRATLFGRQHTPLLSTECKNNQINWMTRWGKICARNWRTALYDST